jgi:hypothetical protein
MKLNNMKPGNFSTDLATTADSNEQEMSLNLPENSVDTKDVIQDVIEEH